MQNKINTIFFDLFGVLLGIDQSVVIQYLSKLTDAPYLDTRDIAMGEPFMRLARIDADSLREIWKNSKVGEMPAVSLLDDLLNNFQIWVISNTTESHIKSLQSKFTFLSQINGIITSERAGAHKPNPKIFQFALEEANVDVTSSLFIDDSYSNIESAENLGIVSHHYTGYDRLIGFLSNYASK